MLQNKFSYEEILKGLSTKQVKAIELIIEAKSITDIALELKVSRKTIYRWLEDTKFEIALNCKKKEMWDKTPDNLRYLTHLSFIALQDTLSDETNSNRSDLAVKFLKLLLNPKNKFISSLIPSGPFSQKEPIEDCKESLVFKEQIESLDKMMKKYPIV